MSLTEVYRGCFDGWVSTELSHDYRGCRQQPYLGNTVEWCLCDEDYWFVTMHSIGCSLVTLHYIGCSFVTLHSIGSAFVKLASIRYDAHFDKYGSVRTNGNSTHAYIRIHTYALTHSCTYMYVCLHARTHTHTHTHPRTHTLSVITCVYVLVQ